MKRSGLIEVIALSDAPTRTERILSDRKAQLLRATTNQVAEQIPCPGQCGGVALLVESPLSVTRDGVTRTIRVAQCQDQCRMESRIGRTGKTRLVPARFDVPWGGREADDPVADQAGLPSRLAQALRRSGLTQMEAAERIGCSQSGVSKMLRGTTMAQTTLAAALSWIASVEEHHATAEGAQREVSPRACTVHPRRQQVLAELTHGRPSPPDKPVEKSFQKESIVQNVAQSSEEFQHPEPWQYRAEISREPEQASPPEVADELVSSPDPMEPVLPEALSLPGNHDAANPYEAVLRSLLEPAAQRHLEQIAGQAAAGVVVRVLLEWKGPPASGPPLPQ